MFKTNKMLMAAMAGTMVLGVAGCSSKEEETKTDTNTPSVEVTDREEDKTVHITDRTLTAGDEDLQVDIVDAVETTQDGTPVIRVDVTLKNVADDDYEFNPMDFQMEYDNGTDAAVAMNDRVSDPLAMVDQKLAGGDVVSGSVYFARNAGTKASRLILNKEDGSQIVVDLDGTAVSEKEDAAEK